MTVPVKKSLTILQGKTFDLLIRWETEPIVYKEITGISQAAPCVIDCVGHGVPDGWRVAVVSVRGMTQINAKNTPPRSTDYHVVTVAGTDEIELNAVNSAGYSAYTSGGYVQYYTPQDLTGYTARMSIKDRVGGTELLSLTSANSRIVIDVGADTIQLHIDAVDTETETWTSGVYDLELVSSGGVVTSLLYGNVILSKEVTT